MVYVFIQISRLFNCLQEILIFGVFLFDLLCFFENYVVLYDRWNRVFYWVFEYLKKEYVEKNDNVDRKLSDFIEDQVIYFFFCFINVDYKRSGYDRGYMVVVSNYRYF